MRVWLSSFKNIYSFNAQQFNSLDSLNSLYSKLLICSALQCTGLHCSPYTALSGIYFSDQQIVNFPANRNRNRFAEPTSARIGIGIVHEFQNLLIGIGIIFARYFLFYYNILISISGFFLWYLFILSLGLFHIEKIISKF